MPRYLFFLLLLHCSQTAYAEIDNSGEDLGTWDVKEVLDISQSEAASAPIEPAFNAEEMAEQKAREAEQKAREAAMKEQAALREIRTFYFDHDNVSIKSEMRAALAAHAAFLASNPEAHVIIEGHTDSEGDRAYNLVLGEIRAKSIAKFFVVNGASSSQIEVISYGEERPATELEDESGKANNRRVFIKYR